MVGQRQTQGKCRQLASVWRGSRGAEPRRERALARRDSFLRRTDAGRAQAGFQPHESRREGPGTGGGQAPPAVCTPHSWPQVPACARPTPSVPSGFSEPPRAPRLLLSPDPGAEGSCPLRRLPRVLLGRVRGRLSSHLAQEAEPQRPLFPLRPLHQHLRLGSRPGQSGASPGWLLS